MYASYMSLKKIEFWADSFHEGNWACEELGKIWNVTSVQYEKGFIPVYTFDIDTENQLEITVLGSYNNWSPLPDKISNLIEWGKPDLIAYDPIEEEIIFAVEETAAVPTGNQALQRCERIYGSLRMEIPFWYLLGEFGLHVDGGVRRDSIWPTVLGIKLSCVKKTPCIVLHYSDQNHPEDYTVGTGVASLYSALSTKIEIYFDFKDEADLIPILSEQYSHMLDFIKSQGNSLVSHIPGSDDLYAEDLPDELANYVSGSENADIESNFLDWGLTNELPEEIYNNLIPGGLIKNDSLLERIDSLLQDKKAYTLSNKAGSRPQDRTKVGEWIEQQRRLFNSSNNTSATFNLDVADFPESQSGRVHVTTAKNVFYLIDSVRDLENMIGESFSRLENETLSDEEIPVFFYVSNSLKPGRIFGDPFTGQLSAFSNVFARNTKGEKSRLAIAYYPHQVHTQLFDQNGNFKKNKGITLMRELLDYAVFQGGVLVDLNKNRTV